MSTEEKAKQRIEIIHNRLKKIGFFTSIISKKDYNYEFTVENARIKVKVQVYFGKKGIKTILQGDEKSELFVTIKNTILDQPELLLKTPELNEPEEYIGTDECGKGDFFGPLVVGAAYVDNQTRKKLIRIGVKDSKELSDNQIGVLANEIRKIVGDNFEVIKITPTKYNQLYDQFKNLNKLLNWAHSKAIEKLYERTNCKFVITDKFSKEKLNIDTSSNYTDVQFVQLEKAEKFVGVAAASILARNSFNDWFVSQSKHGLNLPKGASEKVEHYARILFKKIDEEKISEIAKLHFKTLKKVNNN